MVLTNQIARVFPIWKCSFTTSTKTTTISNYIIKSVDFKGSFVNFFDVPFLEFHEYAFIGRSNVGKSSLINALLDRKNIARISNTPGKTQTLNLYQVNEEWNIMDLPGYGYARISKKERAKWERMIYNYLDYRDNLACVMLLIDSRVSPQALDLEFANWLGEHSVPFCIVFTKSDKLKPLELESNTLTFKNKMLETWESLPSSFITSSVNQTGRNDILEFIQQTNLSIG